MQENKKKTPSLANWLVSKLISDGLHEEFLGDLEEIYQERMLSRGKLYAKLIYWVDVLHLLVGFTSFNLFKTQNNPAVMYKHYLHISGRNLARSKVYSLINILSLAVGMGVCLTIGQFIYFELSYDKFHDNYQNIHRIILGANPDGEDRVGTFSPTALGPIGKETIPGIKEYVRLYPQFNSAIVTNPNKDEPFKEPGHDVIYVDPSFFQVFNFPLKSGSNETVFANKFNIVITEKAAHKYFGSDNPMGKTLKVMAHLSPGDFIVSGVLEDLPVNSHLQFEFLLPLEHVLEFRMSRLNHDGWEWNTMTYLTIDETANLNLISDKLDRLTAKHRAEKKASLNITMEKLGLQPIADIHLKSDAFYQKSLVTNSGNIENLQIFSIITFFILIIAWVNYINLSTARSMQRTKEVGIRKSIGAYRKQWINQFMIESLLVNFIAALLAIGIASLTIPILSDIIGKELALDMLRGPLFWLWFLVVVLFGSLLSGLYPAFILSAFKPVSILGANKTTQPGKVNLRSGLIVFQFLISLLLISGTYLVYKQITFMKNQKLGIDMEKILVLSGPERGLDSTRLEAFRTEVARHHSIVSVATSAKIPGEGAGGNSMRKLGAPISANQHNTYVKIDFHFPETYDFEFLAGSSFTQDMAPDFSTPAPERNHYAIINEEAVRAFGFGSPEKAIQETFISGYKPGAASYREYKIIGVVKNFHWGSLKDAQAPGLFVFYPTLGDYFSFKMNLSNIPESLAYIDKTYKSFFPGNPFEYFFLDDAFNSQYQAEVQFRNLFLAFSVLAIFIACIGLFALVSYSTTLRIKEIGIRKVFGAGIGNIMVLLSWEYVILLSIATILAIPAIIYWGGSWLENYAFRTNIGFDLFIIPALVLLVISFLTVSQRTYSTAKANPVDSLRAE